jgi:dihydropteroate synthase
MTKLVAILNLTPDSFSDGGKYEGEQAVVRLEQLIEEGADVVDIGAESTRPGATPLSAEEEWARLAPFFKNLKPEHFKTTLSLDTRHPENARRALDVGFRWINDVSGFASQAMREVVAGYDCTCVVMHSLSVPADKNITLPEGCDVIAELVEWALGIGDWALGRQIIIDPGIGFGKTAAQSWEIINRIDELKTLGFPLLIGHSRKSFLNPREGGDSFDRDKSTLELSQKLIVKKIDYLRVHDVAAHKVLL